MQCYSPLLAWRGDVLKSGKREMLFRRPKIECASLYQLKVPCGKCFGCRLEHSRQWAMRCLHEASLYATNSFVTLTYSDEHLPKGGGLVLKDFQLFMKRLRKVAGPGVRFFHCGEYGEKFGRPHYHAILFNYDFPDKVFVRKTDRGDSLWSSSLLGSLWTQGMSIIGNVTFESAAYVARYVMKKISISEKSSDKARAEWQRKYVDEDTGEIRDPEYITMSRGSAVLGTGGIGKAWYNKYKSDIYPQDYAILRGMKVRPPKFYDGLYEISNPMDFFMLKAKRVRQACKLDPTGFGESGDRRLRVKEEVKKAQLRSLSRNLEV